MNRRHRSVDLGQRRRATRVRAGFSLLELMAVMAIIVIMLGLTVAATLGFRVPGMRNASISQIMQALEEARMTAIETSGKVYVGFADNGAKDEDRRLRSFILFRPYTAEEKADMTPHPSDSTYKPLTRWQDLPKGFYLDPDAEKSLLRDSTAKLDPDPEGLPGGKTTVYAVAFSSIGQVVFPQRQNPPQIAVTEAHYDEATGALIRSPGEEKARFAIQINRLTGRVQFGEVSVP